jgi:hypothetical protein
MKTRFLVAAMCAIAASTASTFGRNGDLTVRGFGPAEAASADAIGITGPTKAARGDKVTLYLTGTPPLNLAEPLMDQLDWLVGDDRMFVYLQMPGQAMVPLDVEGTIVFGAGGATMRPHVSFVAAEGGEYRLIVDWNYRQNQLVEHVVAVEGKQSPKPPEPTPTPAPLSVLLSYEAGDQTSADPAQADLLTDPQVRAYLDGHCVVQDGQPAWRFLDLSDDDAAVMPTQWQTVIARARGKTTPWLIIDNGNATYEGPCPANAADLLTKLKEYGGE